MKVTFEKPNRFVARVSRHQASRYDEIDLLERAKFHYDDDEDYFWTSSFEHAARLRDYFDDSLKKKINKVSVIETPWSGRVLVPNGKSLEPIQEDAVRFAMSRNNSYIAYDMGLGKTPIGVTIINCVLFSQMVLKDLYTKTRPALIVVPPFLVSNWLREIDEWKRDDYKIQVVDKAGAFEIANDTDILIVPDSRFSDREVKYSLMQRKYSVCLVDEAHRFLGEETNRTQFLFGPVVARGLVHWADKVVLLSGTPMSTGPIQLYPTLKALAWNEIDFRSYVQFGKDFCAGFQEKIYGNKFAWNFKGESNLDLLKEKLDNSFIIREKLEDNVKSLRGKLKENVVVLDGKVTKKVQRLEKVLVKKMNINQFLEGRQDKGAISEYRAELAKVKLGPAAQYILNILDSTDEKVLVLAHHVDLVQSLSKELNCKGKYAGYDIFGKTPMKTRTAIEKDFQSRDECRFIVANIGTMVGINLTKATRVIFAESSWSSTDNEQARSRAYRIGQTKKVLVEHLVLANTLDEYVLNKVIKKKTTIQKLF